MLTRMGAYQPQPYAAIDLIHKQPVRWMKENKVSCDGGGGALGHPKIFINLDKPQICWCTYCGLPFVGPSSLACVLGCVSCCGVGGDHGVDQDSALTDFTLQAHEHHRKLLESQPSTSFPLDPVGDAAEVPESQRVSDEAFGQR